MDWLFRASDERVQFDGSGHLVFLTLYNSLDRLLIRGYQKNNHYCNNGYIDTCGSDVDIFSNP